MKAECGLCDPNLGPVVAASNFWRIILNRNQNLLGKCFLALHRHLEAVPELSPTEWTDLHKQLSRTTELLTFAFSPNHFNYSFLQNQDRHIHLHIIPRYKELRRFAGVEFSDPDYPGHYSVPAQARHLTQVQLMALAKHLQRIFAGG